MCHKQRISLPPEIAPTVADTTNALQSAGSVVPSRFFSRVFYLEISTILFLFLFH